MICVDFLQPCEPNARWRWNQVSHLHCLPTDNIEDLHRFAQSIGLKRAWFQPGPNSMPHYDLTPGMRSIAVRAGATELNTREAVVANIRAWREHRGRQPVQQTLFSPAGGPSS